MSNNFEKLMADIMSEALAKIEALTDDELRKVVLDNEGN